MFAPIRSLVAFRPSAAPGLLAGAAAVSAVFGATAFLVPVVSDRFGVALGTAGLIAVVQVGGFTIATLVAGRRIRASHRVMVAASLALVAGNAGSALVGWFWLLLAFRLLAGLGAGLVTWLAWIDAMKEHSVMKDVAGVGPLTALVSAPLFGALTAAWGDRPVFVLLAVLSLAPLAFPSAFAGETAPPRRKMSPSRSNLVLLGSLTVLTLAGSSMWAFLIAMAEDRIGLAPAVAGLALSANAAAGLLATRLRARPGTAALWMAGIAASIASMVAIPVPVVFFAGMAGWGFFFWMAIPEVLRQIAAWSLSPEERVGDAQGLMALGRVGGPALGGLLVGSGSFIPLGIEAAAGTTVAVMVVGGVERYRKGRPVPVR